MKENQETTEAWGENGEADTGQSSVQSLLLDFCDYTSAHGPSRICGAKRMFQKVLWSLLFVGAVTMFTYQIYLLFQKFQSRPLNTLIRMEHDSVSKAQYKPWRGECNETRFPATLDRAIRANLPNSAFRLHKNKIELREPIETFESCFVAFRFLVNYSLAWLTCGPRMLFFRACHFQR